MRSPTIEDMAKAIADRDKRMDRRAIRMKADINKVKQATKRGVKP